MYFESFPKVYYTNVKGVKPKLVTNLLRRIGVRDAIKTNAVTYTKYLIKNSDTPESLAFDFYGDANLHYVILLTNDIYDRYHQWPMTSRQFQAYINDKYADANGIHHYEISQSSGDTKIKINIGSDNTDYPAADAVSNVEYEEEEQDIKRKLKILYFDYVPQFIAEYKLLLER